MENKEKRINALVGRILALYRSDDRAKMAQLRRAAQLDHQPSALIAALPVIGPQLARLTDDELADFILVASLFALHPHENGGGNFGNSFRRVDQDSRSGPSIEKRFQVLLDTDRGGLRRQLHDMVSLTRARGVSINWFQLLTDVLDWSSPDREVQFRWAKSFYTGAPNGSQNKMKEELT